MSSPADYEGFLAEHHPAAMVTIGPGGVPKAARVGVALVAIRRAYGPG